MNELHVSTIASELSLRPGQVAATALLLEEGSTVPFIARYRKEATGTLDEVAITSIRDRLVQLMELDDRRMSILKSLEERGLLTDDLKKQVAQAPTMAVLEDVYLPYKPKRRTRATIAKEKGLEPLAELIWAQDPATDLMAAAQGFVSAEKGVESAEAAIEGAKDIIAERVNEDQQARGQTRELFNKFAIIRSTVVEGKNEEGKKYEDYFEWSEPVTKAPSHRILAMRRGRKEGFLKLEVTVPEEQAVRLLEGLFAKGASACTNLVKQAVADSYKRLLAPSMETEVLAEAKMRADQEAIRVFAENLRQLLLASPLGPKNVLAIDPGFRTGCKVVCLDPQGQLKYNDVIYPHTGDSRAAADVSKVVAMCEKLNIDVIAIGNGTAGRETETYIRSIKFHKNIPVVMVNESGASIYSASDVAREEFPNEDVTVRGAVSIGRRLMDPLAELVKIDPKSIGVGQYQHDVDQTQLKQGLDDVVISCVNNVGVEVNTASKQLLQYVSGLGPQLAQNIVSYRNENGAFKSRSDLMNVPRLGAKAFEQAAGFLRIRDAANPLDASAVHPESYGVVDRMASSLGCGVSDLMKDDSLRKRIRLNDYVSDTVGLPTLNDIMQELAKPGRDPRQQFEIFSFAEGVNKIEDVHPGMKLPGIVTNVTAFGAFVDIGVHQDGLVHISQLADRFVKDPAEVVKVQQRVMVTVIEVDLAKQRIGLSLKTQPDGGQKTEVRGQRSEEKRHGPEGGRPKAEGRQGPRHDGGKPRPVQRPATPAENSIGQLLADFARQKKDKGK
jgi:protein Tex